MPAGIVFIAFSLVGLVFATTGRLILRAGAIFLTRGVEERSRRKAVLAASLFPWLCLGWGVCVFTFQSFVNQEVFHKDPGIGEYWDCPLPNGYALRMIKMPGEGWLYDASLPSAGMKEDQAGALAGVRVLQLAGRYIAVGSESDPYASWKSNKVAIDDWYLLDTATGRRSFFSSEAELRAALLAAGFRLNLESIDIVFSRYRYTWFDRLALGLLLGLPTLGFAGLAHSIFKARRPGAAVARPA